MKPEIEHTKSADQSAYTPQWSEWTRRLMIVILLLASIYAITLLKSVVQMLTVSFILTFLLFAPARGLTRRTPLPYAGSVVVVYIVLILTILFLVLIFIPAAAEEAQKLAANLQQTYADIEARLEAYQEEDGIITILGAQVDLNFIIQPVRDFLLRPPGEATFNNPLNIPLDNTASILDFVSYPGGDTEDRVRWDITGMNPNAALSGGAPGWSSRRPASGRARNM